MYMAIGGKLFSFVMEQQDTDTPEKSIFNSYGGTNMRQTKQHTRRNQYLLVVYSS